MLPANLPARLRAAGLEVVEIPGWRDRGRPGSFDPVGVLWHHTGSYDGLTDAGNDYDYAMWLAVTGRPDLPAPLCQVSISAEGVVYVCAAGRANHAGRARASGTVAAGDGNTLYAGVECMNSGSQGWGRAQYDAMVTTGVVLGQVIDCSPDAQRGHRETSVTGKWDPGLLDLDQFRTDILTLAQGDNDMTPAQEQLLNDTAKAVERIEAKLDRELQRDKNVRERDTKRHRAVMAALRDVPAETRAAVEAALNEEN